MKRQGGVLMHISSLPGPGGIGSLGKEAFAFADFLHDAGMAIWQVLPMGPTGFGESPYQSASVFAGNPLLISVETLAEEGLAPRDVLEEEAGNDPGQVDYQRVREKKMQALRRAFAFSGPKLAREVAAFERNNDWVRPYALFIAVKEHFGSTMWTLWPDRDIRNRKRRALARYEKMLAEEIRFHIFCQYLFFRQWQALKAYCAGRGISLFGDIPIYVAEDSADTWTRPDVFQLDKNRLPRRVAGVPPDYFSENGQLWGNPLYRWGYLRLRGYDWWIRRLGHMQTMYDIVRIDHFIGFANYYSIPRGAPNAKTGQWVKGPGAALFKRVKRKLPGLRIVAEDLGAVNDRVRALLAFTGYPGMKVLSFAFSGGDDNIHLPANIDENTAYYTGTHDNVTALAWARQAPWEEWQKAQAVTGAREKEEAPWAMVRTVFMSRARIAVAPMQDLLGLGDEATMNRPGTIGGNWQWRMLPGAATPALAARLNALNAESNRRND